MKKAAPFLIGGGLLAIGAAWWSSRRTASKVVNAISGVEGNGVVKIRATGYWPYQEGLSASERKMEGGTKDRKGAPIHTLEMHMADPAAHPYVSVAGDYEIWPYGQRVVLEAWPGVSFRVVDTGGHFHGVNKIYRVAGYEPLDIAVNSSTTPVPKLMNARIIPGDNFEGGKAVAAAGFKGQTVVTGFEELYRILGA